MDGRWQKSVPRLGVGAPLWPHLRLNCFKNCIPHLRTALKRMFFFFNFLHNTTTSVSHISKRPSLDFSHSATPSQTKRQKLESHHRPELKGKMGPHPAVHTHIAYTPKYVYSKVSIPTSRELRLLKRLLLILKNFTLKVKS